MIKNSHSRDMPRYLWLALGAPLMAATLMTGFPPCAKLCLSSCLCESRPE